MSNRPSDQKQPVNLLAAIGGELEGVAARPERDPVVPALDTLAQLDGLKLVGLAFSGGGIRSATFNLGVLQTLNRLGLLTYVDYLSTVSGGGYTGSWYLACLQRGHRTEADREPAVRHLRQYSRYLAPEGGFFSADTWTIVSTWIRNTLLLQTMLVSLFAIALLTPRIVEWAFLTGPTWLMLLAGTVCVVCPTVVIVRCLSGRKLLGQSGVQLLVVIPGLVGATCMASLLWSMRQDPVMLPLLGLTSWSEFVYLVGAVVMVCTWATAYASLLPGLEGWAWWKRRLGVLPNGLACGALFVGLGYAIVRLFRYWERFGEASPWLAALIGSPAVLIALSLCVVLQIGLLGRAIDDGPREWWARLGAFLVIYALGPLALGLIALFGPPLAALVTSPQRWQQWLGGSLTVGGIITTLGGVLAARSSDTGGRNGSRTKELLATMAPYVFITGLLVLVATGLHHVLRMAPVCDGAGHWDALNCSIGEGIAWLWWALAASAALLVLFAYRIDINEASMNPFYRNRLVRCYLGASRSANRSPDPFTQFDPEDDFGLSTLRPTSPDAYTGPVPIVNAALNLPGGGDAALQERRATSFFFTPYYSGSDTTEFTRTCDVSRYEGGIRVGWCVATSGAAASPNMGYHTSTPIAFLLTFFNVRLGLWIRNPRFPGKRQSSRWGFYYLLKELFATAGAGDRYIYLSDGGHFENLGVYELVRRRCRYIIVGDAEQDGTMGLQGLGSVVRKCRIDFGVEIDIDTSAIRALDKQRQSRAHGAVGRIQYPPDPKTGAPGQRGYLLYLKSSITGDEDSDVLQYKAERRAFPHESTDDQFFSESQFESYRALGEHVAEEAFRPVAWKGSAMLGSRAEIEGWMHGLWRHDGGGRALSPETASERHQDD